MYGGELHGAEDCDFVKVMWVWIEDTGEGWEPGLRCLDDPVTSLALGWPTLRA